MTTVELVASNTIHELSAPVSVKVQDGRIDALFEQLKREASCWDGFKKCFRRITKIEVALERALTDPGSIADLNDFFLTLLASPHYSQLRAKIRHVIVNLSQEQRTQILHAVATKEPLLSRLLTLMNLDEVTQAAPDLGKPVDLWIEELALSGKIAQEKQQKTEARGSAKSCCFFQAWIDTLLTAFRFFSCGVQPGSSWEASHLITLYGNMFAIPAILFSAMICFFPALVALCITLGILTAIITTVILFLKYRQQPSQFPPFHNLTEAAAQGENDLILARDKSVDAIISCLMASDATTRQHPIVVGVTGVGKTEIVNALAQRIVRGDVPEALKDVTLHSGNTSDILGDGSSPDSLTRLQRFQERVEPYKDHLILFCDEFQAILSHPHNSDKFCKLLDTSKGCFRYFIAATTTEDYEKLCKESPPLVRRLKRIDVGSTDKEETMQILRHTVRQAKEIEVTDKALEAIYDKTKDKLQPINSKLLLNQIIAKIRLKQNNLPDEQERKARAAMESLNEKYRSTIDSVEQTKIMEDMKKQKAIADDLETKRNQWFAFWPSLSGFLEQKKLLEQKLYDLALKATEEQKKLMVILKMITLPALEKEIETLRTRCPIPYLLTPEMVADEKLT